MNSSITCVNGPGYEIKAITCDGEPWFCASDVCNALKLPDFNEAFYRLDKSMRDWKCFSFGVPVSVPVVNSEGLYALYLLGNEPETTRFKKTLFDSLFPMMGLSNSGIADRFKLSDVKAIPVAAVPQQTDKGLQVFSNSQFGNIRGLIRDGEPWFVGKDMAIALGYVETAKAIREHVDDEDKGVSVLDTPGGKQSMTIINESGMYSLIFASKLPAAKEFKHWVTSVVLPSIRKYGGYMLGQDNNGPVFNANDVCQLAETLRQAKDLIAELNGTVTQLKATAIQIQAKDRADLITITAIANAFGFSARWLNKYLAEKGIQFRRGANWLLCPEYAEQGYMKLDKQHTYWTQKGRKFVCDILENDGFLRI